MSQVIWITGQSGAGKTTLGRRLAIATNGILLDGDEMRESISLYEGFSKRDRERHNLRVARLAEVLQRQRQVVVSVIAPYEETRKTISTICDPFWVFLERNCGATKERPYEIPSRSDCRIGADLNEIETLLHVMEALADGLR